MTDSYDESNFYVPSFVKKSFQGLLLPGQKLEEIFDHIGGLILEEGNEIRPDETVWGSKTMVFNKKKAKTLDMFFNKVIKTEISDVDSNCSINSGNEPYIEESSVMNRCKSSPGSMSSPEKDSTKISDKNLSVTPNKNLKSKINKSKSRRHSVSSSDNEAVENNANNSPTYSVDLFAEETRKTSDHANKTSSSHSLSDEEIPSSQVSQTSKKSNSQNISREKEISSSEDEDNEEEPALSELDSIKNSMKNIKEIFSEIESNTDKFTYGDLTEDDELYILQCPREIDGKKLKGVKLPFEGHSIISVDEESKYDCFSIKENSKRYLYVALPDPSEQGMKLGFFPLAGNIILSESLGFTYTEPIEDDAQGDVLSKVRDTSPDGESPGGLIPQKKKEQENSDGFDINSRYSEFGNVPEVETKCDDTQIIPDTQDQETPSKTKREKKRSKEGRDINSSFSDFNEVSIAKTERKDCQVNPETQDQETPSKRKKEKKRSLEGKDINSSFSDLNEVPVVKTNWEESQIIPETQDQETPLKTKKKKKRSKEGKDVHSGFSDVNEISLVKTDWEDSQIIPGTQDQETPLKTKKKKKRSKEGKDVHSSFSDLNEISLVKTDQEDSQIIPETQDQETPFKTKKKKKKYKEDLNEVPVIKTDWEDSQIIQGTEDRETPLKVKKKKKKSKEDTTQDEATESEFFSDNVTDVLNKLASKKKKRKHYSLGSNELTDYETELDKFLNIKTELEEPQVISDFQETPSKSKKRSRKNVEDSEEFSKEEVPKKKKKKKHSYSENQEML